MIAPPKRENMFDFSGIPFVVALNQHLSSVFLVVSEPIHYLAPTRRPTQAYAACEGRLRDHKSASRCLPTRANVEFKCRSALWQLQLENRNFSVQVHFGSSGSKIRYAVQVRIQHLSKDLAARKGLRTQDALKAYANAYAGLTRSLREDCRTNSKRSKFLHTWQTVMICSTNAYAKSLVGSRTLFSVCLQQLSQTHAHPTPSSAYARAYARTNTRMCAKCLRDASARLRPPAKLPTRT